MAIKGRAGVALATAAIASFFAGTVATVVLALFAPPLAEIALKFGPAEFFSLMVLGLLASLVLARGSLLHASGMVVLGLLLGLVGSDVNSGMQRYTFDIPQMADGIGFVVVAMGMFGLAEVVRNLENENDRPVMVIKITSLMPTREDWCVSSRPSCAVRRSVRCSASCLAAVRSSGRSRRTPSRRKSRRTRPNSARAPPRALPLRSRPTTRAHRRRSFRC